MKKLLTLIFAAMMAISMSTAVVSYAMPTQDDKKAEEGKDKKKSKKKKGEKKEEKKEEKK